MELAAYLIKMSAAMALVYIFYHLFLRQLTFYQWNRFYLLFFTLVSFLLPFVDITPWISERRLQDVEIVTDLPVIPWTNPVAYTADPVKYLIMSALGVGMIAGAARLIWQYLSFRRMRKNSVLLHCSGKVRIFATSASSGAFSFGNDIYVNTENHSGPELERIILHEMVHVEQQHTFDLMWGETVRMLNWYNPFAWLLRNAIRQNLEFIADQKVLQKGYDKQEYQLLLLKVTGVDKYRVTPHFNIHDLKKRIMMMNKMKSAKLKLATFFCALPMLVLLLVAFRGNQVSPLPFIDIRGAADTVPPAAAAPGEFSVGRMTTREGNFVVIMKKRDKSPVTILTLSEWNRDKKQLEQKYGKLPELPVPPAPPRAPVPAEPKTPEIPEAPETPDSPETPETPDAPDAPEIPEKAPAPVKEKMLAMQLHQQHQLQQQQQRLAEKNMKMQKLQQTLAEKSRQLQLQQRRLMEKAAALRHLD